MAKAKGAIASPVSALKGGVILHSSSMAICYRLALISTQKQCAHFQCFLLFCALLFFNSCTEKKQENHFPQHAEISGIASVINLQPEQTKVLLDDFFKDVNKIDSVSVKFLSAELSENKKVVLLDDKGKSIPELIELKIWIENSPHSLLLKKSRKVNFHFRFESRGNFDSVQLAGEFNNWSPKNTKLRNENGAWTTDLILDKGKYQYQVVANGKWMIDPNNHDSSSNGSGGYNSILKVSGQNAALAPQLFSISSNPLTDSGSIFIGLESKSKNSSMSAPINSEEGVKGGIGNDLGETEYFVFWENYLLDGNFVSECGNNGASYGKNEKKLEIKIPIEAKNGSRSFIRVYASNKYGASNDLLIPLQNGEVLKNASSMGQHDLRAMILYFLMPDRFSDGDVSNNYPVKDKEVDFKANYQGGDLKGITKKIQENYFSDLGINTLWISPIVQNPLIAYREYPAPHRKYSGYHGYWPISSTQIDSRFGNDEDFMKLVDEAHKKNIKVLLDYVSNHVHQEHPLYNSHPDWFTKIDLPDGRKNIRLWDEYRLTTWFDTFLPDIDYSKPEVVDAMSDSALYWIKKFNLDGFRHDAAKHVPEEFWRTLTKKLKKLAAYPPSDKAIAPPVFQIGETFGSRELIGSYVNSGEQDAQFDFNLYFDARSVFAEDNESFEKLNNSLMASFDYYGNHSLMGNITGNHDLPRFISLASGALKFNEDDKAAGWSREIKNENPVGYKKLASLTAFMMTIPGVPVIYYGDEIGMPGAGDPDNRRMMKFTKLTPEELAGKSTLEKLCKLRKERLSMVFGDFEPLSVKGDFYAYARTYFDEITIVVFNKSAEAVKVEFEIPVRFADTKLTSNFGAEWDLAKNILTVELNGNSFEILTNKTIKKNENKIN